MIIINSTYGMGTVIWQCFYFVLSAYNFDWFLYKVCEFCSYLVIKLFYRGI